jgi:hypothetical protein
MMIKLFFIILGLIFLAFAFVSKMKNPKRDGGFVGDTHDSEGVVNMVQCNYCLNYFEKQPVFNNEICEICDRKRATIKK